MAQQEVILITGANTGLGFQMVRALCQSERAYSIIVGGRSLEKIEKAIKAVVTEFPSSPSKLSVLQIDIEHDDSIKAAFDTVNSNFGRVDALVNNAGAQFDNQLSSGEMTEREMWNQSWNINTTGTQIMTSTFIPLLLRSPNPRLLFITSGTSTLSGTGNMALAVNRYAAQGWPKNNFDGKTFNVPAYRSSKTGMNMMMREWHRALHEDGVKVWCVSPGFLATGLGAGQEFNKGMGGGDPAAGANLVRSVLEGDRDEDVGKVVTRDGVQAW